MTTTTSPEERIFTANSIDDLRVAARVEKLLDLVGHDNPFTGAGERLEAAEAAERDAASAAQIAADKSDAEALASAMQRRAGLLKQRFDLEATIAGFDAGLRDLAPAVHRNAEFEAWRASPQGQDAELRYRHTLGARGIPNDHFLARCDEQMVEQMKVARAIGMERSQAVAMLGLAIDQTNKLSNDFPALRRL
jgi:hypothetical protein